MKFIRVVFALLAALALMSSARAEPEEAAELPSLARAYRDYFPIGVAVSPGQVMAPSTAAYIASQFNMVVAENAMKPVSISRDAQGKYDFAQADAIVDFGVKNGLKVRGHTLIWHQQGAPWMFSTGKGPDDYVDRDELIKRMRTYIHDVVGHFKGRVHAWDVVNEIFVPDEVLPQESGWRKSLWYTIIGPEFVELAFKFAHEADPDALLFYNDYGTESPKKRALILEMIKNLQAKGIAIHGIGHQSHYTIAQPQDWSGLEAGIVDIGKLGLTNHITELDISLNRDIAKSEVDEATPELLQLQADRYQSFFEMAMRQKQYVTGVVLWGLNDANSWLLSWPRRRFDAPLLFDEEQAPKPAFWSVVKLPKK